MTVTVLSFCWYFNGVNLKSLVYCEVRDVPDNVSVHKDCCCVSWASAKELYPTTETIKCRNEMCGNVRFLHGWLVDGFSNVWRYSSWDKSKNSCLCRDRTFPNLALGWGLTHWAFVLMLSCPSQAPHLETYNFPTGMGSCYISVKLLLIDNLQCCGWGITSCLIIYTVSAFIQPSILC